MTVDGRVQIGATSWSCINAAQLERPCHVFPTRTHHSLRSRLESPLRAALIWQVEDKMSANQRRYMLMEQLKHIKKELGLEKDEKETLAAKFTTRLEGRELPPEASKTIEEELAKLATLEPASSEFNVTRNYLDWLTLLPWNVYSDAKPSLARAEVSSSAALLFFILHSSSSLLPLPPPALPTLHLPSTSLSSTLLPLASSSPSSLLLLSPHLRPPRLCPFSKSLPIRPVQTTPPPPSTPIPYHFILRKCSTRTTTALRTSSSASWSS